MNIGTRLGPYEIVAPLGAGGMGEVYRAHDAKLGRDVAIKILSNAVAGDPDRIARFEREARVLAGLNHPHIAAVYGFQQSDGVDALVMELDQAGRPDVAAVTTATVDGQRPTAWRMMPWGLAVAASLAAVAAIALWAPWRKPAARTGMRLTADFGAPMSLARTNGSPALALSPDGAVLAFTGQPPGDEPRLYVRRLDQLTATPLERADGTASPFFSPDGQWLAFFSGGKLKKIAVNGGASITLADAPNPRGGAWAPDGTIVFAPGSTVPLSRVSASGGTAELVTKLAATEVTHRWPQIIDGGRAVLFTSSAANGQYEDANILVQPLPGGTPKVAVTGGFYGRYVPSGHIVFAHAGTLFAVPFNLGRLEAGGPPIPVVQGVSTINGTGAAQFAIGPDGMLVYVAGEGEDINLPLMWLDSRGTATPLRTTRSNWGGIQFAPDGRRLAMSITSPTRQVYVYDWAGDSLSQLTFDTGSDPVWSPDGRDIVFGSRRDSPRASNLYVRHADGSGEPLRLSTSPRDQTPASWHPSGKFIAFTETGTSPDLMLLPLEGDSSSGWKAGKPEALVATQAPEWDPAFSPDGRWLAYSSGTSGRPEIYVQPFPTTGGSKWKVSGESGGRYPVWSRTSRMLMFMAANGRQLMSASYAVNGNSFQAEKPRVWGEGRIARLNGQRGFDLHPDGTRVVVGDVREPDTQTREDRAVFVLNFFDELRRIAPAAK